MKLKLAAHLMLAILASGCSNEDLITDVNPPDAPSVSSISVQMKGIHNYIASTRKATRGFDANIRPYIDEDGDTLMYIAEYQAGWELFSNSLNAPMSLMKSDTGRFNDVLDNSNPVVSELLQYLLLSLKEDKQYREVDYNDINEQWACYVSTPTPKPDPDNSKIKTLVGTKEFPYEDVHISHMLKTKWGQGFPYNTYMPKDSTNEKSKGHIFVGCTAVAVGQLLYYSHYKWKKPTLTPFNASYNESKNQYEFTQFNSYGWDRMLKRIYFEENDPYTAMFLGWIAKSIGAKPSYTDGKHTGTSAGFSNAASFIKQETGYTTMVKNYNRKAISELLKNNKPVLLWLYANGGGHVVVIDAMDYHASSGINYYAYITPGGDLPSPDPTPTPPITSTDPDYDALVSKYGEIYSEPYSTSTSYFKFNWGYCNSGDDDYYINGDVLSFIFHDKDEDITYKPFEYIDYEVN